MNFIIWVLVRVIHFSERRMKKILFILLLFITIPAWATDYYVKNGGNDAADGKSDGNAWETVTKVNTVWNAGTFAPGDNIYFNRGDEWYGVTLIPKESGTAGNPITIGAYGTGDKPIISGFTTLSSWTDEGDGIYSKSVTSEAQTNVVTVDGIMVGMGRYPDATYLTYESYSGTASITDNELGASPDWDNAEVVIRLNDWAMNRNTITDHTGTKITYTSLGDAENGTNNSGYFIQNDLRCVTATNEWYHDYSGGKLYIYGNPSAKVVKMATLNYLVSNTGSYDYITFDNITFEGAILDAIYCSTGNTYITVQNCTIQFIGRDGIYIYNSASNTIDSNIINDCHQTGIWINTASGNTITNNTINNCGVIAGGAYTGTYAGALNLRGNTSNVRYNTISNCGSCGIIFYGNTDLIEYNLISNTMLIMNDGGGIYTGGSTYTGREINYNIVLSSFGNYDGTNQSTYHRAHGIYLDEYAANITVSYNSCAYNGMWGIKLHKAHENTITNNVCYDNYGAGIGFNNSEDVDNIYDVVMNNNYFIAKASGDLALEFLSYNYDGIPTFGTADYNYYARPIDDDYVFYTNQPSEGGDYRTLAGWQAFTSQDAHSSGSPVSVADTSYIDFYYNASQTDDSVFTLPYASIDMAGTKYATEVTLDAYEGIVLLKDPDPDSDPPNQPTVTTAAVTNVTSTTATCGGNVTDDGGGTVSARGVCWSTTPNPTTSDSKTSDGTGTGAFVSSLTGLSPNLTYYVRAYATNEIATVYGTNMEVFTTKSKVLFNGDKILMVGGKIVVID